MKKIILTALVASTLVGAEDGFDLAPTPVSQTEVKSGESEKMTRLTYITSTLKSDETDFDVTGGGVQVAKTDGKEGGATNLSGSLIGGGGSGETTDVALVSANIAYLWENYNKTTEGAPYTIFYGLDFSYTYMNLTTSGYYTINTDIYFKQYGGTLGIQYNMHTPGMIFSPFAVGKYLMGDYESHTWVGDNYTYMGDSIDPMLVQNFGFDIYFKSMGTTLSAMVKNDSASSTTMISYAWRW